jgi:hypothetical protein
LRLRAQVIHEARVAAIEAGVSLHPICSLCNEPIENEREIHVDHIQAFDGPDDPLRLDKSNVRVTHFRCHMRRTARQRREISQPKR